MITLTKEMHTGVVKIDAQHIQLVDMLNNVISMGVKAISREETQKTLDFLSNYVVKHFSDEEILQKQSGYPKYEWHKNQHQLYVSELFKLKKEFAANGVSTKFTLALNNSIVNWIVQHIKFVDVEFGKYYQAHSQ